MQFRPPERLEKWIAYDGAIGAELLVAEPEAADNADDGAGGDVEAAAFAAGGAVTVGLGDDEDFSVGMGEADILVSLPDNADSGDRFPYLKSASDLFDISGGVHEDNIYIEISNPAGGKFGFFLLDEGDTELTSGDDAFNYIDGLDGTVGGRISAGNLGNSGRVMFLFEENGAHVLREFKLVGNNKLELVTNGAEVQVDLPDENHGLRFHVTKSSDQLTGNELLEQVFRSLTFTPDGSGNPPPNNSITGFDVTIYHNNDGIGIPDGKALFHDGAGGIYNPENEHVAVDSTDPDFRHITLGNLDNGGGGGGDDIIPPVIPPAFGDSGGDGDGSGEDGGDETGEDGGDSGGEGDSGSGQDGDDMGYIFQSDDEAQADDGGHADDAEAEARDEAAPAVEQRAAEDRALESAAEARQLELARDMEFMLTAVRNEKAVLLDLIGRLQSEYLSRDPAEYGELREYLRRLFDMGGSEQETVNRILAAMNREMDAFRAADPGQRDGMLAESIRELIDSAERHSGEMGAYSQAIEAVATLLAERRIEGLPPPGVDEVEALFAAEYGEALAAWLADAGRSDPMGRELTAARHVGEAAQAE